MKLNAEGSLFNVKWGFDAKNGLLLHPNPVDGGASKGLTPYFPKDPVQGPLMNFLANSGVTGYLTILLFGNQDLVSHCYADYHFRRVGLDHFGWSCQRQLHAAPHR